jgi:large subunit ribosomal protein L35
MPKQKPHKGLGKRVKVTARGKVVFKKAFAGHLMSGKSGRRKQWLRRRVTLTSKLADKIRQALTAE